MSLSKKRHIQESNLILEGRYLSEAKIDPAVINFAKSLNITGDTKFNEIKNKNPLTPNDEILLAQYVDTWCTNKIQSNQTIDDNTESICKKAIEQLSGEQSGRSGLFGFRYH